MTKSDSSTKDVSPKEAASDVAGARAKVLASEAPAAPSAPAGRAKHLLLADTTLVPARMINEVLYCERLMYLEWVQGEWADNYYTADGQVVHKRANRAGQPLKAAPDASHKQPEKAGGKHDQPDGTHNEPDSARHQPDGTHNKPDGTHHQPDGTHNEPDGDAHETRSGAPNDTHELPYSARSVWLSSAELGITAKMDVVDVAGGTVVPIEYKRGKRPNTSFGAYLPERAQVCAQVLMLREHGFRCDYGEIYFAKDRQRHRIEISDELIEATKGAAERCRELAQAAQIPPPLNDSPKCHGCSLVGICLPDETIALRKSLIDFNPYANANEVGDDPWGLVGTPEATPESTAKTVRRMYPARDDRVPLYVQAPGATVNLDGERLIVRHRNQPPTNTRLSNTSHVALFGNSHITTPALKGLMRRGIPLLFFSYGGWYQGRASGPDTKNVELRLAQYKKTQDSITCLRLAQSFVASKILNCRTLLRRNHRSAPRVVLSELKQLARKARQAETTDSLLGIEGSAARVYFSEFAGMLKGDACDCGEFDMAGRNRRPPKDPINALLSFCYSLLTKELLIATHAVGLDSLLGFYHKPHFGRPSLALDLMEEFRPIIADSVVLNALNTKVVQNHDFQHAAGAVTLTDAGRRRLIQAFERRMDQPVTHPVFDYRISYRRVLEVQARLLTRYLLGEIAQYPEFRIR